MKLSRLIIALLVLFLAFVVVNKSAFSAQNSDTNNTRTSKQSKDADDADDSDDKEDTDSTNTGKQSQGTGSNEETDIPKKNVKFKGDLLLGLNMGMHEPNSWYRKVAKLVLGMEGRLMDVSFKVELEFMYDTLRDNVIIDGQQATDYKRYLRAREVWAEYETNTFDRKWFTGFSFKIGHILYSWGKGDEYRPSDILNPQDYSNYSFTVSNDRKIPVWSLNLKTRLHENWRFSFILIPIHSGNEIPGNDNPWQDPSMISMQSMGITGISLSTPEKKLANSTYAVKTYFKLFDVDFSIGYLSGYGYQPVLISAVPPTAYMEYKFLRMITFDFEFVAGGIGFRGELGYFPKGKYYTQNTNLMIERKQLSVIFGFDKTDLFIKGMYINIQFIWEHIFDRDEGSVIAKGDIFSISLNWYYEGRVLKVELGGIYGIVNKELMLRPKVTWKVQNDFNVIIGAIIILGKNSLEYSQAPLGKYYNKDYIFIEANYSF